MRQDYRCMAKRQQASIACLVVVFPGLAGCMSGPRHSQPTELAARTDHLCASWTEADVVEKPIQSSHPEAAPTPCSDERVELSALTDKDPEDFGKQIRRRQELIYQLSRQGEAEFAAAEFEALLDDIEAREGSARCRSIGRSFALHLCVRRHDRTAALVLSAIVERWADGPDAAETLFRLGSSYTRLGEHSKAELTFQRLIEEHDGSVWAPLAWQGLALGQSARKDFSSAIATLDMMGAKYKGSAWQDGATVTRGNVLRAEGRVEEARAAYESVLESRRASSLLSEAAKELRELSRISAAEQRKVGSASKSSG